MRGVIIGEANACLYIMSRVGHPKESKMKKYKTISLDPPWPIKFDLPWGQGKKTQYKTMSIEEITALPVRDLADETCNLFVWTTQTYLPHTFDILKAWGFKYHCAITWDKGAGLVQFGFNRRTEFVLYAYNNKLDIDPRGQATPTIINDLTDLLEEKSTVHSRKPERFYRHIEHKTKAPRLEMFARAKRAGWDVWGNEVESDLILTGCPT